MSTVWILCLIEVAASLTIIHILWSHPAQDARFSKIYSAQTLPQGPYDPTMLLIKFKPSVLSKLRDDFAATGIGSITAKLRGYPISGFHQLAVHGKDSRTNMGLFDWYEVTLNQNHPLEAVKEKSRTVYPELEHLQSELASDSNVEAVSKNYLISDSLVPNDPYYSSSGAWGQAYPDLWGIQDINSAGAWDTTTGSSSTVIAVVDTGVDITQPDIAANIWTNPSPGSDGYANDTHGWNWCSNNNNVMDDNGHGTHVAGTIGAVGNNGLGVVGVNWNVKIMPLKFMCANGSGTTAAAALALEYAADNGARISNNSWEEAAANDPVVDDAITYETSKNVIPVVAAGNNNGGNALDYTPASADGAITVAAVDNTNTIASFSNTGERIDVSAPGVNILSLKSSQASSVCTGGEVINTNYCLLSGTSMATPHVAGTIGLMLSKNPSLTVEQIRQILHKTATSLGSPGNTTYGYGLVNAQAAVTASTTPTVLTPVITSPASRATVGGAITVTGTANGATLASWKLEVGQGRAPTSWATVASGTTPITNGTLATLDTTTLPDNSYTFTLISTDTGGQTYQYSTYDVVVHNIDAIISTPFNIMAQSKTVPIVGQADVFNGLTFNYYTIDYGIGASPTSYSTTGVTLTNNGTQPEPASTDGLGQIDTSGLANGTEVQLRLTVYATNGAYKVVTQTVYIDQNLVSGWPIYLPGANPAVPEIGGGETYADLEGNGQQDIIIPSYTNKIYAFRKDGTAVPGWPITVQSGDYFEHAPIVASLDSSGKPDIIVEASITGGLNRRLYIFQSDGTPYPGWTPLVISTASSGDDPMPSVADLNNNGQKELVMDTFTTGSTTSLLHAYLPNGSELSGWPKTISYTPYIMMPPTISDVNGDGYPEIILPSYNQVYVYDHTGTILSGWPVTLPTYNSTLEVVMGLPAVGNLDGDGQKEIIVEGQPLGVLGYNVTTVEYAYHANGTLLSGWPYVGNTYPTYGNTDVNSPITADINHDGKDEVIVGSTSAGYIEDGVGRTAAPNLTTTSISPSLAEFSNNGTVQIPGMDNHNIHWFNMDYSTYWEDNNIWSTYSLNITTAEEPNFSTIISADIDGSSQEAFSAGVIHQNELYAYLWQLPGPTNPSDSWPMFGHDAQHTNHFTVGQITTDTTPPTVPTGLSASNVTDSSQQISWNASTDDTAVAGYQLFRGSELIATTSAATTSFTDTGLMPLTSYTYSVVAYDTSNNYSAHSATLTSETIADTTPPNPPPNVQAIDVGLNTLQLTWSPATDDVSVTGYDIYLGSTFLGSTSGTSYSVSNLKSGTFYSFTVVAVDEAGNLSQSSNISATTLRIPGDVNGDGVVNIFDLSLLLSHFNQNYPPADFNNNGVVDIFDLSTLLSHYGQ